MRITVLDLWCIIWTVAERLRLQQPARVPPPIIPGRVSGCS